MSTIKLRAPEGRTVSLEGRPPIEADKDGAYMAHPRDVDALKAHGFEVWNDHPGATGDIETMTKEQLVDAMIAKGRVEMMKMSVEDLRVEVRRAQAEDQQAPTQAEIDATKVNPGTVTEDRIATMKRSELFAYLAANKVSSPPPVSNDELRTRALDTLRNSRAARMMAAKWEPPFGRQEIAEVCHEANRGICNSNLA